MTRFLSLLPVLVLLILSPSDALHAAEASPVELRLRETLRSTMLQLRDAQGKIDTLQAAQAALEKEKAGLKTQLEELTKQSAAEKKTAEKEHAKLAYQIVLLQRVVADHETKNQELFKLANEILVRYEKFGLGDALTAREPFVGITRVKIQNLVQDYQDKVANQEITHEEPPPSK